MRKYESEELRHLSIGSDEWAMWDVGPRVWAATIYLFGNEGKSRIWNADQPGMLQEWGIGRVRVGRDNGDVEVRNHRGSVSENDGGVL